MGKGLVWLAVGLTIGCGTPAFWNSRQEPQKLQTFSEFPNLTKGLAETPGCLGTQVFNVNSNKTFVIAAWFENRHAVEAWYSGPMHSEAMKKFFPGMGGKKPFAEFKDEKAPILVVASVTPGDKAIGYGSKLAVSQIAIEGYTPIPGGLGLGGTFSPEKFAVPGLVRLPAGGDAPLPHLEESASRTQP